MSVIVVGENLRQLALEYEMCPPDGFDGDSLKIRLGERIKRPLPGSQVSFLGTDRSKCFEDQTLANGALVLEPHDCVLACSLEYIRIPPGFIGEIKPTSTTNRDFFSLTLGADYVASGWEGALTLELRNYGPFVLNIPLEAHVGQLFVHRCSDSSFQGRGSRYSGQSAPMHAIRSNANG